MRHQQKPTYPLNKGDFYIENGACIACGAPQAEAPDIISHSKTDNHCFFKKQPESPAELDQAISAMMVSCISALRYGGSDEKILKRLYENAMSELCDNKPLGNYPVLVRDQVTFHFNGTLKELSDLLTLNYKSIAPYVRVENYETNSTDVFSFTQRWATGKRGVRYACHSNDEKKCKIKITVEEDHEETVIIGASSMLHDFLKKDARITHLKWFAINKSEGEHYDKPY